MAPRLERHDDRERDDYQREQEVGHDRERVEVEDHRQAAERDLGDGPEEGAERRAPDPSREPVDATRRQPRDESGGDPGERHETVAELDHRVKNVLATVQAVASHTMQASSSMEHFVTALNGRIRSMASTHELLSHRRWLGIPLAELVERELAPYTTGSNAEIGGPEVMLNAEAGQAMATVLHELVTNAAKYGALSVASGRVSISRS